MNMVDGLLAIVAPQRCQQCGAAADALALCGACRDHLPWNIHCCPRCALPQLHDSPCAACARRAPAYDRAWCPWRMEGPLRSAIHELKYGARFLQAQVLSRLMAEQLARRREPLPQRLIPVPLHGARLRRRGYNQALELARGLGRCLDLPVAAEACTRLRPTADQIGQSAAQRRRNMRGAFGVRADLRGLHVALLDDVMTTGATLGELARVCHRAGAAKVEIWAAARVA